VMVGGGVLLVFLGVPTFFAPFHKILIPCFNFQSCKNLFAGDENTKNKI